MQGDGELRSGRQLVKGADVGEQEDEQNDGEGSSGKHADPQIPKHVHPAAAEEGLGLHPDHSISETRL